MTAAERELDYEAVTTYPEAARPTCEWIVGELERGRTWEGTYLDKNREGCDYEAEDAAIASVA
jgi:hypothetical protein